MSGFDKSMSVSSSQRFVKHLKCGICEDFLNNPITTPCCHHLYCKQCISGSIEKPLNMCPNGCKQLLFKDLIPPSEVITKIMNTLKVDCIFMSYGCLQSITLSQLSDHKIQCMFDPNKSYDKCFIALKGLNENIDKIKDKIIKEEYECLKKQLDVCQREFKLMSSRNTPKKEFKKQVIESAKNNIENSEMIAYNLPQNNKI